MNADDFDDYWVKSPKTVRVPAKPALQIDTIKGVEPLDTQFGVTELKAVPDALYEPLFGQPSDTPLHTYAILDAAKVPNLPELLEASGLNHRCMFKGDAYDELKDVAPWIVQLEDENAFTRNLFTQSDAPWCLWGVEPGIYVRSGGTLDDMWKHFRKFTKVQDEQGKWIYFRFWEGAALVALFEVWQSQAQKIRRFWGEAGNYPIKNVICSNGKHWTTVTVDLPLEWSSGLSSAPFQLGKEERDAISAWRTVRFDDQLVHNIWKEYPQASHLSRVEMGQWVADMIAAARDVGITLESALTDFVHAAYLLDMNPTSHGATASLLRDPTLHQKDRARLALKEAKTHR